jgi:hypothetical protein
MALTNIASRARSIIYGAGLGEQPTILRAAANATEGTTAAGIVTFSMTSGDGAKVKAGRTLSVYDPDNRADAHVIYVLSLLTDAVTGINGYLGSPSVTTDGDLDSALLEQNAMVTNFEIFEAIDTVIANMLWPHVFDVVTATIASPDLVDGQEAVPAEVEAIVSAWQVIGPTIYKIPHDTYPMEVHTSLASTGKLASFGWINATTGYYTYRAKFLEADEADTELTQLIALGAAALCLGASVSETTLEATKKDNAEASTQRGSVGDRLMRDFLQLRQNMSEELGRRGPDRIKFNRG